MNEQAQAYWDGYGKATQEESGGGGGIISLARVETGYKVFASGVGQDESWFPASAVDKAERATAKKAAAKLADEYGCRYTWGIAICTPREKSFVHGEKATWNVPEMVRFTPSYSSACNDVVIPSLKEHGLIADGSEKWMRLGFVNDPYAVENDKKDSQGRYAQVSYVTEVFKNPKLALKAIGEMPKRDSSDSNVPEGYNADDWAEMEEQYLEAAKGTDDAETLAADWGVPVEFAEKTLADIVPV